MARDRLHTLFVQCATRQLLDDGICNEFRERNTAALRRFAGCCFQFGRKFHKNELGIVIHGIILLPAIKFLAIIAALSPALLYDSNLDQGDLVIERLHPRALRTVCASAAFALAAAAPMEHSAAQAAAPATSAPAAQLTSYTAPDKTATAGLPPGWKVTMGAQSLIRMSGPNGEMIDLGVIVLVKDGPYQAAKPGISALWIAIPNSTPLAQKYTAVIQGLNAGTSLNLQILSSTPIPISKNIADCARLLGTVNLPAGPAKFESGFCSLPVDSKGVYKVIWKTATIPNNLAAQERATAEAVLLSYSVPQPVLMSILSPHDPVASAPQSSGPGGAAAANAQTAAIMKATIDAQRASDQQFQCFDLGVMREEPEWKLPPYCR